MSHRFHPYKTLRRVNALNDAKIPKVAKTPSEQTGCRCVDPAAMHPMQRIQCRDHCPVHQSLVAWKYYDQRDIVIDDFFHQQFYAECNPMDSEDECAECPNPKCSNSHVEYYTACSECGFEETREPHWHTVVLDSVDFDYKSGFYTDEEDEDFGEIERIDTTTEEDILHALRLVANESRKALGNTFPDPSLTETILAYLSPVV